MTLAELEDFYTAIEKLEQQYMQRDLEEYLRELLVLVRRHRDEQPCLTLFLDLLKKSFYGPAAAFNPEWLQRSKAPDSNVMSRKFTNAEVRNIVDKRRISETDGIDFLFAVLEFQIAELYKMQNKQLKDGGRYFGVDSEAGNRWYNFDPFTNLECGVRCLIDGFDESDITSITWATLGEILESGRIYE